MTLLDPHRQKLEGCGLRAETCARAGLHSGSPDEVRELLGYGVQGGGLVIPYDDTNPNPDGRFAAGRVRW